MSTNLRNVLGLMMAAVIFTGAAGRRCLDGSRLPARIIILTCAARRTLSSSRG